MTACDSPYSAGVVGKLSGLRMRAPRVGRYPHEFERPKTLPRLRYRIRSQTFLLALKRAGRETKLETMLLIACFSLSSPGGQRKNLTVRLRLGVRGEEKLETHPGAPCPRPLVSTIASGIWHLVTRCNPSGRRPTRPHEPNGPAQRATQRRQGQARRRKVGNAPR